MLSEAGYAVLQVNFRGSGGYGQAFTEAGAREWGGKMQDDVTDATRWLIQQGIADPGKTCIYGASYGAYTALMGAAKEPGLYKCAAGYVGVYDLPMMHAEDSKVTKRSATWMSQWVGVRDQLGKMLEALAAFKQSGQCYDLSITLRREAIEKIRNGPGTESLKARDSARHERVLVDLAERRREVTRIVETIERSRGRFSDPPR
jgi:predicted acyl esterase